jgi:hypothetical protein
VRAGLRRERASVRVFFPVPGLELVLATGARREVELAEDFAAVLPLVTCPLRRLRAATGLALRKLLAPLA